MHVRSHMHILRTSFSSSKNIFQYLYIRFIGIDWSWNGMWYPYTRDFDRFPCQEFLNLSVSWRCWRTRNVWGNREERERGHVNNGDRVSLPTSSVFCRNSLFPVLQWNDEKVWEAQITHTRSISSWTSLFARATSYRCWQRADGSRNVVDISGLSVAALWGR